MKTFIIGLFSLALLASDPAAAAQNPKYPQGPLPKFGAPAICKNTGGIMVIVLQKTGDVTAFACSEVDGRPIKKEPELPPGIPSTPVVSGSLGNINKYKNPNDADPCIVWKIGGTTFIYCW